MKKVLIISPYFPPANAADMQRVRMSLPYFLQFGWEAEVVCVDMQYVDIVQDSLLLESFPKTIKIHSVKALSKKITSKLGLGSIALRSLWYYYKGVKKIFNANKFDLIYFSTTQFPVCILGALWKKKFGIPYIIDMQDPWHSDYYQSLPKNMHPKKYWFSYRLNKLLEPIAMNKVDGIISVSNDYISVLKSRYKRINTIPTVVITFGANKIDLEIAKRCSISSNPFSKDLISIVYIGRGGNDMLAALSLLFSAFKKGLALNESLFSNIRFYFLGTSYAAEGSGLKTITPLAEYLDIGKYVVEQTNRLPFYEALNLLQSANMLFIPGSNDPQYTASKIYPYILMEKPMISIFHQNSSAVTILNACVPENCTCTFQDDINDNIHKITTFIADVINKEFKKMTYDKSAFSAYSAEKMVEKQVLFFNKVILRN